MRANEQDGKDDDESGAKVLLDEIQVLGDGDDEEVSVDDSDSFVGRTLSLKKQ